jgi:hypothetical protein
MQGVAHGFAGGLRRQVKRPEFQPADRALLAALSSVFLVDAGRSFW